MAKINDSAPKPQSSHDFNSARATVWRELSSMRSAVTTGKLSERFKVSQEAEKRSQKTTGSFKEKK